MRIKGLSGEFAFQALIKCQNTSIQSMNTDGWAVEYSLSKTYFKTKEEAISMYGQKVIWPVEVYDDGSVYIPDISELE